MIKCYGVFHCQLTLPLIMDYHTLMSTSAFTRMVTSTTTTVLQFLCSVIIRQATCSCLSSSLWMQCAHNGIPNWLVWHQIVQIVMMGHHNGIVIQIFTKGILRWRLHSSFWWVVNIFPISIVWVWELPTTNFDRLDAIHMPKEHNMLGCNGFIDILIFAKNIFVWTNFFARRSEHRIKPINWFGIITFVISNSPLKLMHHLSKCSPRILLSINRLKIWRIWSFIRSPKSKKLKY